MKECQAGRGCPRWAHRMIWVALLSLLTGCAAQDSTVIRPELAEPLHASTRRGRLPQVKALLDEGTSRRIPPLDPISSYAPHNMKAAEPKEAAGPAKAAEPESTRSVLVVGGGLGGLALGRLVSWGLAVGITAYAESEGVTAELEVFAFPVWLLMATVLFSAAISVLAGVYPAYRAARVDPIRSLRQE